MECRILGSPREIQCGGIKFILGPFPKWDGAKQDGRGWGGDKENRGGERQG